MRLLAIKRLQLWEVSLLLIAFAIPQLSYAQGVRHVNIAQGTVTLSGSSGFSGAVLRPLAGATITVCTGSTLPPVGTTCTGLASIYVDIGLTGLLSNPTNADSGGNYSFYALGGLPYVVSVSAAGFTTQSYVWSAPLSGTSPTLTGTTSIAAYNTTGVGTHSGTETFTGTVTTKTLNGAVNATQFSGADIFAQANAAAASAGSPGVVLIPPGTYSGVTTTLNCVNRVRFIVAGVTINTYTVSAGTAIKIQNVANCAIEGPMLLKGPGSGTSSVGIQLGIGAGGSGTQLTIHNHIKDIQISGFGKAFFGDGTTGGNGTYWNLIENIATSDGLGNGNGIGFYLVPTSSQQFNNNVFNGCWGQYSTTDGWVIDGSYNSIITGPDAENNGRYGMNFSGNFATISNTILGGHFEANTTADFNFGSGGTPSNISELAILGPFANSATPFVGNPNSGTFNIYQPSATPQRINYPGGSTFLLPVNANAPVASIWQIFNSESPPSGVTALWQLARSGADAGNISISSPEYPIIAPLVFSITGGAIKTPGGTVMGLTLKKGSGGGNYTNATTSYTVADSTNLCYTVTIPTGWKLGISASGALSTATAAVVAQAALTDNAACSTANAGILVETAPIQGAGIGIADAFALNWVITGDGAAHNIALQFKTSNASDTASLINSSATITPTMKFELMPSN